MFRNYENKYMERSTEFVIKVGAGTEAVGLFESIHLFVYKLMLQNARLRPLIECIFLNICR
jgi:hypothetical protein